MDLEKYYPEPVKQLEHIKSYYDGNPVEYPVVTVSGDDYEICEKASGSYWAKEKPDTEKYNGGLICNHYDSRKEIRVGILGEIAFAKLFKTYADLSYRQGGDKCDFTFGKARIDVKTGGRDNGKGYVLHIKASGQTIPVDKHIYPICFIHYEDRIIARKAVVAFAGFALNNQVTECPLVRARRGGHWNYEVPYHICYPIEKLISIRRHLV